MVYIMLITATELKSNMGKYLSLAVSQDIIITKNGKSVAKLTSTKNDKIATANSLFGIIPNDGTTLEEIREERLVRYETAD